jgi:hypothetical protein
MRAAAMRSDTAAEERSVAACDDGEHVAHCTCATMELLVPDHLCLRKSENVEELYKELRREGPPRINRFVRFSRN